MKRKRQGRRTPKAAQPTKVAQPTKPKKVSGGLLGSPEQDEDIAEEAGKEMSALAEKDLLDELVGDGGTEAVFGVRLVPFSLAITSLLQRADSMFIVGTKQKEMPVAEALRQVGIFLYILNKDITLREKMRTVSAGGEEFEYAVVEAMDSIPMNKCEKLVTAITSYVSSEMSTLVKPADEDSDEDDDIPGNA